MTHDEGKRGKGKDPRCESLLDPPERKRKRNRYKLANGGGRTSGSWSKHGAKSQLCAT